ncbi:cation diffusion facilitator family transporter [Alkalihalobacillus sp. CinArs1]|uniref:cation diffusion facilitator family transporter n=1 Tax=Alkalihalobacillus sp. CinArs1 TaxID=2995314 RepID=UPI0022DD291B|nr:cation diffusion facilitator family transporter [Alkalihalobacillus sp. CinArs1]
MANSSEERDKMGHHNHSSVKNIKTAFFLNFSFTIIEIIGGLLTNSMAILSDALHDLGDSLSLGISWYLQKKSNRKGSNATFSFGYRRFSLLGALINSIILIGGSLFILTQAVPRLLNPEPVQASGMMVLAILGVLVNGAAVFKLRSGKSMNEKVVTWHLLEDVLGWVAVLIVSIVLMFKNIPILDPILSVMITLYVLVNVIKNLKKTLMIFLDAVPEGVDLKEIKSKIVALPGIISTHHTHLWSLDGEQHVLSTHIVVEESLDKAEIIHIKERIQEFVEELHLEHLTIQVDYQDERCLMAESSVDDR